MNREEVERAYSRYLQETEGLHWDLPQEERLEAVKPAVFRLLTSLDDEDVVELFTILREEKDQKALEGVFWNTHADSFPYPMWHLYNGPLTAERFRIVSQTPRSFPYQSSDEI